MRRPTSVGERVWLLLATLFVLAVAGTIVSLFIGGGGGGARVVTVSTSG